jgi:hypothetical protein
MKTSSPLKFIQSLSPDLYSFAYILIPDDLQATQLMIDSVAAFLIQKKSLLDKWTAKEESAFGEDLKVHLYKSMYDLSKKRYNQLRMSFKNIEDNSGFFSLDFDEKAALFLKERTDFREELIEFILGKTRSELLAFLYSARIKMVTELPSIHRRMSDLQEVNN